MPADVCDDADGLCRRLGAEVPLDDAAVNELATGAGAMPAAIFGRRAGVAPPSSMATAAHSRMPAANRR